MSGTLCLKVDVCTHQGMRDGVPRLLEHLARADAKATFCLAFGPDNAGKAIANVFRPGFVKKMLGSGAPSLYGWRTMVSGTLLPARPIASGFPELVRAIDAAGHEVALHGWDHRLWQDHVESMDDAAIRAEVRRAADAFASILGRPPRGAGAPAWLVTERSLAVQDEFGLAWASDLRGGPVGRVRAGGRTFATPQIPTSGRCIEELLSTGVRGALPLADALVSDLAPAEPAVLAVHAEVEGGPYAEVLDVVLARLRAAGRTIRTLGEMAASLDLATLPVRGLVHAALPGRSGRVATTA